MVRALGLIAAAALLACRGTTPAGRRLCPARFVPPPKARWRASWSARNRRARRSASQWSPTSDGRFRFPGWATRERPLPLAHSRHRLRTRRSADVDLGAGATDIAVTLRPAADLAAQLTNTEWLMSMPGTAEQKRPLIECMSCHSFERIVRSTYNADDVRAGARTHGAIRQQYHCNPGAIAGRARRDVSDDHGAQARRLSRHRQSEPPHPGDDAWSYELQTLPRPKGRATHVVITEYALPRPTIAPHDVRTDAAGPCLVFEFRRGFPRRVRSEDRLASRLSDPPAVSLARPRVARSRSRPRRQSMARDDVPGRPGEVRRENKTFAIFPVQPSSKATPAAVDGDAAVRRRRRQSLENDVARQGSCGSISKPATTSGSIRSRFCPRAGRTGLTAWRRDDKNNLYFMDFGDENIGRIDAKTGEATLYPTPTRDDRARAAPCWTITARSGSPNSPPTGPRCSTTRPNCSRNGTCRRRTLIRTTCLDKNGELWSAGMASDRVLRFDPESGRGVRISIAAADQYPARLCRHFDRSGDVLGRQQSRRRDRAARACSIRAWSGKVETGFPKRPCSHGTSRASAAQASAPSAPRKISREALASRRPGAACGA